MNDPMWEYVDRHDKLQGPFSTSQMRQWYTHRMLPANLPIRFGPSAAFRPLNVIFGPGKVPFESLPTSYDSTPEATKALPRPKKDPKGSAGKNGGMTNSKGKAADVQYFPTKRSNEDGPQQRVNNHGPPTYAQPSYSRPNTNYGQRSGPSYGQSASSSSSSLNHGDAKPTMENSKKGITQQPGAKKDGKGWKDGNGKGKDAKDGKGRKDRGKEEGKGASKSNDKGGNDWCGWNEWHQSGDRKEEHQNALDPRKWEYLDAHNKIQGPFDHVTMLRWYEANLLPSQLKVRAPDSQNWGELGLIGVDQLRHIPDDIQTLEYVFEQRNRFVDPPACWSVERVIRESDGSLWEEKWVSPLRIRFSQKEIHPFFHHRGSIEEVLPDIEQKILDRDDGDDRPPICELHPPFPPIRVVELSNQARMVQNDVVITLDNRRLYALQRVALEAWPKLTLVKVWASPWSRLTQKKLKSEWRKFSHGKDGGVAAAISSRAKEWETWDWRQESAEVERIRFPQLALLPMVDHPRAQLTGTLSFSLLPLFFFCYLNMSSVQKRMVKNFPMIFHIAKVFGHPIVANFRMRKILQKHTQDLVHGRACRIPKVGIPYTAKATVKVSREGTHVQVRATLGKGPNGTSQPPLAQGAPMSPRCGDVCAVEVARGSFLTLSQLGFTLQMLPWAGLPIALASKMTKARRRLAVSMLLTYGYFMVWRAHRCIID